MWPGEVCAGLDWEAGMVVGGAQSWPTLALWHPQGQFELILMTFASSRSSGHRKACSVLRQAGSARR